MTDLIQF